MDPLSDVLALLKPRSYLSAGFDAGGDWAVRYPPNIGIKCYSIVSGQCWLAVDGVPEPTLLKAGDCFLLPGGRPFVMGSDLSLPATDSGARSRWSVTWTATALPISPPVATSQRDRKHRRLR